MSLNVNDQYKSLHPIFQTQLHQYVISNNAQKFDAITEELGFNNTQQQFLFNAIQTSATDPYPNAGQKIKSKKKIKTKNKTISGHKRTRNTKSNGAKTNQIYVYSPDSSSPSDIDTEFGDYKSTIEPSKKRSKLNKINSMKQDYLTAAKISEMEEDDICFVEEIIDHQEMCENEYKYNVKWCGDDDLTWEPKKHLTEQSIKKYWNSKGYKMDKFGIVKKLHNKKNVSKKIRQKEVDNDDIIEFCHKSDKIWKFSK
eukprot:492223_1